MINLIANLLLKIVGFLPFGDHTAVVALGYSLIIGTGTLAFIVLSAKLNLIEVFKNGNGLEKFLLLCGFFANMMPQWWNWLLGILAFILAYFLQEWRTKTSKNGEKVSWKQRLIRLLDEENSQTEPVTEPVQPHPTTPKTKNLPEVPKI